MADKVRIRIHSGLARMLLYDQSDMGQRLRVTMREQFPHFRTSGEWAGLNYCYVTANIPVDKTPYLQTVLEAFMLTPKARAACEKYEADTRALCCAGTRFDHIIKEATDAPTS